MTGTEDPEEPAEPETFALPAGSLSHLADLLGELDAFLRSAQPVGGQKRRAGAGLRPRRPHLADGGVRRRSSPPGLAFLARLHQVEVLRVVLVQNYVTVEDEDKRGREVIKRREAQVEGFPPGRSRITSPYDTDARWSVKRDTFWNGYKVHITETCATSAAAGGGTAAGSDSGSDAHGDDGEAVAPPRPIVNVETTNAAVPDSQMTAPVHARLAGRDLLPAEHYVDSGYPSAELLVSSLATFGITLVTPMLADTSPQARVGAGFDRAAFAIDFDAGQATCPQGRTSSSWNPVTQRGTDTIVITFPKAACKPCPLRPQRQSQQLTLPPPFLGHLDRAGVDVDDAPRVFGLRLAFHNPRALTPDPRRRRARVAADGAATAFTWPHTRRGRDGDFSRACLATYGPGSQRPAGGAYSTP